MNILNELTRKNLRQNKKRTLVTIFGIMLSVALVTAITTFISSMQSSMIERARKQDGNYHILVSDIPVEEQKYFLNYKNAECVMTGQSLGEIPAKDLVSQEEGEEDYEPEIRLRAFDEKGLRNMGLRISEGRLPENETEVVFPAWLDENYGVTYKVGDKIALTVNGQKKEYTITGRVLLTSFEFRTSQGNLGNTLITKLAHNTEGETMDAALLLKDPEAAYELYETLTKERGYQKEQVTMNDTLLRYQGEIRSESVMQAIYKMAAVVIAVIVFTSVFVIKNSFDISIMERTRQYGMLSSIGATSKQIKRNVLFEGLLLGAVAIPAGVACGIFAIWLTLLAVMKILQGTGFAGDLALSLHISPWAVLAAVLIAVVTIFISALLPARKAAKIAPVEAIRGQGEIKISIRKLRTMKGIQKFLGIEGELADKNLKRSRKKYRTTVFSIFVSVLLFVSVGSTIRYAFLLAEIEYQELGYNLIAYVGNDGLTEERESEIYKRVGALDGVKRATALKSVAAKTVDGNYSEDAKGNLETGAFSEEELNESVGVHFYSVPDEQYKAYLRETGLSYEEAKNKALLADSVLDTYQTEDGETIRRRYNYLKSEVGDLFSFQILNDEGKAEGTQTEKIEIAKRVKELPFGVPNEETFGQIRILISEEQMKKYQGQYAGMRIEAEDTKAIRRNIEEMDETLRWNFTDYEEIERENKSIWTIVSIFVYGFIGVISVIGITNIFNTITTNMALRSREFAILKSVGMTDKEFRRMIRYESILYGLKALAYGLPAGVLISYLFYHLFIGIVAVPYELPWQQMGIATVFVFLIVFLTMGYSVRKTKGQNIIETIRNENI